MREIVAARLGTFVTNNPLTIQKMLAECPESVEFFDRDFAKRIAHIIGGEQRHAIANGPTLFLMDERGEPHDAAHIHGGVNRLRFADHIVR